MEQTVTGSSKLPYYSKLQELLTSDRNLRRSDLAETSSAASSGDSLGNGDDGTNSSSDAVSDKYRNPRKRLLLSSMNASEADESTDDLSEKGKRMMKWKSDASNGGDTSGNYQGPASSKVAPIVLKRYHYPNAVESADLEEFLVLLSEDETRTESNGGSDPCIGKESSELEEARLNTPIKSKDDYDYMGAQIDKLLSMPVPTTTWKAPRRQRRFQCEACPKSYSTEDDLKSHVLCHSEGKIKPFGCELCDKRFTWKASLKAHRQKVHHRMKSQGTEEEEESDSSHDESLPSQEEQQQEVPDNKIDTEKKVLPKISATSQQEPHSFESVVSKMLSSGLVSNAVAVAATIQKTLPPRRQCSTSKDVPITRRSTPRKDSKSKDTNKVKGSSETKKVSSPSEQQNNVASPQTPTTNRTSLRRNIQRPKWLTDADLVTDYEFPRGTNIMRMGGTTNSPPATGTVGTTTTSNGNQSHSRKVSTDSTEESTKSSTTKSQKCDKLKAGPPSSRDRKRKEESEKKEQKKKNDSRKSVRTEIKPDKADKNTRSANKSKSPKNIRGDNESPSKQLSTKILTLSLNDIANETPEKLPPVKNARKRAGSESPCNTLKTTENRKSKRIKSSDAENRNKELNRMDIDADATTTTTSTSDSRDHQIANTNEGNSTDGHVETNLTTDTDKKEEIKSNLQIDELDGNLEDITDAKKLIESTTAVDQNEVIKQISDTDTQIPAQTKEVIKIQGEDTPMKESSDILELPENSKNISSEDKQLLNENKDEETDFVTKSSDNIPVFETQKIDDHPAPAASRLYFNNFNIETPSFADLAKSTSIVTNTIHTSENKLIKEPNAEFVEEQSESIIISIGCGNDEEMPVLRPETSSSAAGSRSDSFAERMQSIDEDVSSSSNHSTMPEAPILAKESASTTFANGIIKVTQEKQKAEYTTAVNEGELTLIDEDEDECTSARLRRDRSDSLSMRSCGSGSQSEKIKALEDTALKEKSPMSDHDHECLVDSDSNDSLMSEFSELAAQISDKRDGKKFKEQVLHFVAGKVSCNSMWKIRKELKRLKKAKNYIKFGKLTPLAAGLMHDLFSQSLP